MNHGGPGASEPVDAAAVAAAAARVQAEGLVAVAVRGHPNPNYNAVFRRSEHATDDGWPQYVLDLGDSISLYLFHHAASQRWVLSFTVEEEDLEGPATILAPEGPIPLGEHSWRRRGEDLKLTVTALATQAELEKHNKRQDAVAEAAWQERQKRLPEQMAIYRKRYIPEKEKEDEAAEAEQRTQLKQQRAAEAAERTHADAAAGTSNQGEHGDGSGLTLEGVRRVFDLLPNRDQIDSRTTTSDLCKAFIQPKTVADGWIAEAELIRVDATGKDVTANRWFSHTYVNKVTGERRPKQPPPGTRSMCQVLAADPETARFVGRPTHFLSHGA